MKIICLLWLICCFWPKAFADSVVPQFSGSWYTRADFIDQDACYQSRYRYTNLAQATDQSYANRVLSDLSPHDHCAWQKAFLLHKNLDKPIDFIGTTDQWQKLKAQPKAKLSETWQKNCVNDRNQILDSSSITIWPHYVCPAGSHESLEVNTHAEICTQAPLVCNADIVGRDLVRKGIKILGHVGLVTTTKGYNHVLEVLPDPKAGVYENTLDSFIHKSVFWGEKYGLPEAPILTRKQAEKIVHTGESQVGVKLKYTFGWGWKPSDGESTAIFRCDSFLYYAYSYGASLEIFPTGFHFPDTPPSMFKRFLSLRLAQQTGLFDPPAFFWQAQQYMEMPKDNLSYVERLAQVFNEKELDIEKADELTYRYVYEPEISRSQKMRTLYGLAVQHLNDKYQFWYLIDILDIFHPFEYTNQLIQLYQQQPLVQLKANLIYTLGEQAISPARPSSADPTPQKLFSQDAEHIPVIRHFLEDLLERETNPRLVESAIYAYITAGIPAQVKEKVGLTLERFKENNIQLVMSALQANYLQLILAFLDKDLQPRDVPPLLEAHYETADKMPYYLTAYLNFLFPEKINPAIKPLLQNYLVQHQQAITDQPHQEDLPVTNWLEAYATVMVDKNSDKIPFMFDYVRSLSDPLLQAKYIRQMDWRVLEKISYRDKWRYQKTFQDQLKKPAITDQETDVYKMALSDLKSYG